MDLLARHIILASGSNAEESRTQVLHFFSRTSLVQYDKIDIRDEAIDASDKRFNDRIEQAVQRNRQILDSFIDELAEAGFERRADLKTVEHGYPSKILHIIAHFLDGFIGIDSAFYNLIDDSHWLPAETAAAIAAEPERYWLFSLECYSTAPKQAALLHM